MARRFRVLRYAGLDEAMAKNPVEKITMSYHGWGLKWA